MINIILYIVIGLVINVLLRNFLSRKKVAYNIILSLIILFLTGTLLMYRQKMVEVVVVSCDHYTETHYKQVKYGKEKNDYRYVEYEANMYAIKGKYIYNNKEYYDYFNVEDRSYRIGETYNIYINPDKPFSNISESIWKCSLCILIISIVFLFISLIKTINLNIIKRDLRIFIKVLKKEEIDKEDLQIERK